MSVYKSLNSQDIIVSPFEVNKSFTFIGGDTLLSASIERHVCSSNISSSLYNSIKQLYYSNYISGSNGEISNATTASIGSDGLLSGPTYNTLYDNYLSTDLNPQRYFHGNNIGVMSIPKNLYGDYIQPNSFNLTCSGNRYVDNGEGIIQKYQEPYFTFCAPEDFDPASQPVNIINEWENYSNIDKKYAYGWKNILANYVRLEGGETYYVKPLGASAQLITHAQTTYTGQNGGTSTHYDVESTAGFPESGCVTWSDDGWNDILCFFYTSKTATSFIGESQQVQQVTTHNLGVVIVGFDIRSYEYGYVITNNSNASTSAKIVNTFAAYWAYIGKCTIIELGWNAGTGRSSNIQYVHCGSDFVFESIGYGGMTNNSLTGICNIPSSVKLISFSYSPDEAGLICLWSPLITKINFNKELTHIGSGATVNCPNCTDYSFYSMTAPIVLGNVSTFMNNNVGTLHIKPNATGYDIAPWTDKALFSEIIEDLSEDTNYVGNIIYEHGIIVLTNDSNINTFVSSSNITASFSSSYQLYETQYKCTITENEYNYTNNPSLTSGSDGKLYDHFTGSYFAPYITTVGLYNDNEELLAVGKLSQPLPTSRTTDTNIIISLDRL